jgi:hypothetical protein
MLINLLVTCKICTHFLGQVLMYDMFPTARNQCRRLFNPSERIKFSLSSEVFTAVTIQSEVFLVVTPCSLVGDH